MIRRTGPLLDQGICRISLTESCGHLAPHLLQRLRALVPRCDSIAPVAFPARCAAYHLSLGITSSLALRRGMMPIGGAAPMKDKHREPFYIALKLGQLALTHDQ